MSDFLKKYTVEIGEKTDTVFSKELNKVYQDGTTPMYRDVDGTLWAITGHSHCGEIVMFKGTCLDDIQKVYTISTNFCVGNSEYAFDRSLYPEGIKARGSIWPMGLYICPNTHRFFCFFHNETGWAGKGTAYDSFGLCDTPKYDSDFRHVGLMYSDDEGKNWTFDRWVLTGENVCFTENYNPENINVIPQKTPIVNLGSGDFTFFIDRDKEFMYIIYNMLILNLETGKLQSCDGYIARSRIRNDGLIGDFVKYYNGSFCEAGNFGRETAIVKGAWHPRVVYLEKYNKYFMSSVRAVPGGEKMVADVMEIRSSDDLTNWGDGISIIKDDEEFGNHYIAFVTNDDKVSPFVIEGDEFSILTNHNGTSVARFNSKFTQK